MARSWTDRLQTFDRRWIFVIMGLALLVPFLWPLRLPIRVSAKVKAAYYAVEDLEPGDVVLVSLDFDPASKPELKPFLRAVLLQLKRKEVKIVFVTTWYAAPPLMDRYIREMVDQPIAREGDGY